MNRVGGISFSHVQIPPNVIDVHSPHNQPLKQNLSSNQSMNQSIDRLHVTCLPSKITPFSIAQIAFVSSPAKIAPLSAFRRNRTNDKFTKEKRKIETAHRSRRTNARFPTVATQHSQINFAPQPAELKANSK